MREAHPVKREAFFTRYASRDTNDAFGSLAFWIAYLTETESNAARRGARVAAAPGIIKIIKES